MKIDRLSRTTQYRILTECHWKRHKCHSDGSKSFGLLIFIGVYGWKRMHFARLKNDNKIKVINEPICDVILSVYSASGPRSAHHFTIFFFLKHNRRAEGGVQAFKRLLIEMPCSLIERNILVNWSIDNQHNWFRLNDSRKERKNKIKWSTSKCQFIINRLR